MTLILRYDDHRINDLKHIFVKSVTLNMIFGIKDGSSLKLCSFEIFAVPLSNVTLCPVNLAHIGTRFIST